MLIQARFRVSELFFGMLLAVAIFALGAAFLGAQRQGDNSASDDKQTNGKSKNVPAEERLADYTFALDALTLMLTVATIGLGAITYIGIRRQSNETRILQRAYLSAEPR